MRQNETVCPLLSVLYSLYSAACYMSSVCTDVCPLRPLPSIFYRLSLLSVLFHLFPAVCLLFFAHVLCCLSSVSAVLYLSSAVCCRLSFAVWNLPSIPR